VFSRDTAYASSPAASRASLRPPVLDHPNDQPVAEREHDEDGGTCSNPADRAAHLNLVLRENLIAGQLGDLLQ
jgi:hypothetical protein